MLSRSKLFQRSYRIWDLLRFLWDISWKRVWDSWAFWEFDEIWKTGVKPIGLPEKISDKVLELSLFFDEYIPYVWHRSFNFILIDIKSPFPSLFPSHLQKAPAMSTRDQGSQFLDMEEVSFIEGWVEERRQWSYRIWDFWDLFGNF